MQFQIIEVFLTIGILSAHHQGFAQGEDVPYVDSRVMVE